MTRITIPGMETLLNKCSTLDGIKVLLLMPLSIFGIFGIILSPFSGHFLRMLTLKLYTYSHLTLTGVKKVPNIIRLNGS